MFLYRAWSNLVDNVLYAEVRIIDDDEPSGLPRGIFAPFGGHVQKQDIDEHVGGGGDISRHHLVDTDSESEAEEGEANSVRDRKYRRDMMGEREGRGMVIGSSPSWKGRRMISLGWWPLWAYR